MKRVWHWRDSAGTRMRSAALSDAITLDDKKPETHYEKGRAEFELGHDEEAVTSFGRVLELDATFADAAYFLGLALEQLGRYTDAITAFDDYALPCTGSFRNLVPPWPCIGADRKGR